MGLSRKGARAERKESFKEYKGIAKKEKEGRLSRNIAFLDKHFKLLNEELKKIVPQLNAPVSAIEMNYQLEVMWVPVKLLQAEGYFKHITPEQESNMISRSFPEGDEKKMVVLQVTKYTQYTKPLAELPEDVMRLGLDYPVRQPEEATHFLKGTPIYQTVLGLQGEESEAEEDRIKNILIQDFVSHLVVGGLFQLDEQASLQHLKTTKENSAALHDKLDEVNNIFEEAINSKKEAETNAL